MERPKFPGLSSLMPPLSITEADMANFNAPRRLAAEAHEATKYLADYHKASMASNFAEHINDSIAAFDAELDQEHEVGLRLVCFGGDVTFHVEEPVRFCNPSLLMFRGTTSDGNRVALVQHVSQVSFLLMALPKLRPEEPKRPFGFHPPENPEPAVGSTEVSA
jgi:hypothetical protein